MVNFSSVLDLSSELVGRLQVRDQLRTEQDAMLLEVQDLTSLWHHVHMWAAGRSGYET